MRRSAGVDIGEQGDNLARPGRLHAETTTTQRIDKWLCYARVVKTRSLAARLVEAGHVRVNGARIVDPAKLLRGGDVLTIALERDVRVLRVVADGERRGPFKEARLLFEDLGFSVADAAQPQPGGSLP